MSLPTTFRITVWGLLWAARWELQVQADGPLQAPTLSFKSPPDGSDIQLFSRVTLLCTPPYRAPYPMVVILGRDTQPRVEVTRYPLRSSSSALFYLQASAENEGTLVCWYNVSRTREMSASSNPLNITISSLPPPIASVDPFFIRIGGNYTVYCKASGEFFNFTLSLYVRDLLGPGADAPPELLGSVTLEDNTRLLVATSKKMDAKVMLEYLCKMELTYNQRLYQSPFSPAALASVEEAPVRLVSRFRSSRCGGRLEVFVRNAWSVVCQGANTDPLNRELARVVCREMGCGDVAIQSVLTISNPRPGTVFVGPVECSGEEARVRDCRITAVGDSYPRGKQPEIVCTDFPQAPELSVPGYGRVSSIYVHEKSPLVLSCMVTSQWMVDNGLMAELRIQDVTSQRTFTYSTVLAGEAVTTELSPPVRPGEYACYAVYHGFNLHVESKLSNRLTVTTGTWMPPSSGVIVGALLTTLIGAGILLYVCLCRSSKESSQTPAQTNTDNPASTPEATSENPVFIQEQ
ncbi:uncharacterized protein si:dkey-195m11.11 [Megalops cyprinoides]|uniref:uncharacterized protein si:dkey-195m11.11 n=1 Tax=Megalops cyprinoides TaxID=118141 RepID=UPI0018646478|nr:uncharacterized protein si:dkey-195m11.11 [Megalops cyprinoides]